MKHFAPLSALALSFVLATTALAVPPQTAGVIDQHGFRLVNTQRSVAFGEAQADVIAHVSGVFGAPPTFSQEQCRTGPLTQADWGKGLKLSFQDGKLVGWTADPRLEGAYTNRAGTVFGRTVAALRAASPGFMLMDAVKGREFAFDGVYGRVLRPGQDATIDLLWAGAGCYRR